MVDVMAECEIEGCPEDAVVPRRKGYCKGHYYNYTYRGDPLAEGPRFQHGMSLLEKMERGYEILPNGCWRWKTNHNQSNGYGRVWFEGKYIDAHRVAYEVWIGPIPEGKDVGHKCHDEAAHAGLCDGGKWCPHHACVNPEHLKAETRQENLLASPHTGASKLSGTTRPVDKSGKT